VAAVSTDHVEIGRIHGRQLGGLCPGGARVLYVQGPADAPSAQQRLAGLEETLRGRPFELKIINGDWTSASAEKAIVAWMRLRTAALFEPQVIVCQNDNMAGGARKALEALRPEWARLPFLGCDGLPQGGRRDVDEGRLAGTVVIPSCAGPAVELVVAWRQAGRVPPARTILAPSAYP
jgi:ABC-type sugar transport system substrate-binding protein